MRRLPLLFLLAACAPTLDDPTTRVSSPRILAVRVSGPGGNSAVTLAEAAPNQTVQLRALYADASGTLTSGPLAWTFCNARKPLAELGPVARACFDPTSTDQVAIGTGGLTVSGKMPKDACRLFGPNPPPPMEGEPSGRPVDPDLTGGYYQPVVTFRSDAPEESPTLSQVRIDCGVANAPPAASREFRARYRRNVNPVIDSLSLLVDGAPIEVPEAGEGTPPVIAPGATIALSVAWPTCPDVGVCGDGICGDDESGDDCPDDCLTPRGCSGAEHYVRYDPPSASIVRQREAISISWYASAGEVAEARTGRMGDDLDPTSTNALTAPTTPGDLTIWVVIRDERGGTDFRSYRLTVAP